MGWMKVLNQNSMECPLKEGIWPKFVRLWRVDEILQQCPKVWILGEMLQAWLLHLEIASFATRVEICLMKVDYYY